jgi:rare lipoprotein A
LAAPVRAALTAILLVCGPAAAQQTGIASIYSAALCGHRTASGRPLDCQSLSAAHRSLRFGERVKVTNLRNGRTTIVRIADRGPFRRGRVIDLSPAAARALGFSGLASVRLDVIGR